MHASLLPDSGGASNATTVARDIMHDQLTAHAALDGPNASGGYKAFLEPSGACAVAVADVRRLNHEDAIYSRRRLDPLHLVRRWKKQQDSDCCIICE